MSDRDTATPEPKKTPAEVANIMAWADGALGAAGHSVEDAAARDIIRQSVAGEITGAEADRRLAESILGYVPDSLRDAK